MKRLLALLLVLVMLTTFTACGNKTADTDGVDGSTTSAIDGTTTTTTADTVITTIGGADTTTADTAAKPTASANTAATAPTQAVADDSPAFVVDSGSAKRGETFTVAVRTVNNPGIVSTKLALRYDTAVLELVSYAEQDFEGVSYGPVEKNPFIINWIDAVSPDNDTNGVISTLTFRVKADAPLGNTSLTLSYDQDDVFNADWQDVVFATRAASITITEG